MRRVKHIRTRRRERTTGWQPHYWRRECVVSHCKSHRAIVCVCLKPQQSGWWTGILEVREH